MDGSLIILFASVIVVGALLFALITFGKRGGRMDVERYRVRWMEIEQSVVRDNEASYHMAILNADKLVDHALKERGLRGETMGDRLKDARKLLSRRDAVWSAHKLRNKIAHEPDVRVNYDKTRQALAGFKRALKDLGAI